MVKILIIFATFLLLNAGNLSELIYLAQSAKQAEFIKFSKNIYTKNATKKDLNIDISGRYTMMQKDGEYKTKTGSMLLRFEYLLFDGGERDAMQKIQSYENASEIYKSEAYKNLISLQVGKIYFNAIAIEALIQNKQNELNAINIANADSEFFYEFGEIDEVEFSALNDALNTAKSELDELYLRQVELISRLNLLSNAKLNFIRGSKMQMPEFWNKAKNANLQAKKKEALINEQSTTQSQSKLIPKIYLKDFQVLNDNSFKKGDSSSAQMAKRYLDTNKPLLELSWSLPSSLNKSTEQQKNEAKYQKIALALSEEEHMSLQQLDTLETLIKRLDAEQKIKQTKVSSVQKSFENLARLYAWGKISYSEFLFLLDDNTAWLNGFWLDKDELEIRKMEYYYERGDEILKRIKDE
ncbi:MULTISPECIES: TolC family protein [unclassified Campylobacter]|uniref:TolC family protein n=1 Tax=unclassified Campylobacter TaxID=2593542 RepID=UPI003D34D237